MSCHNLYLKCVSKALDEVSLCLVPDRNQISASACTTIASSCPREVFRLNQVAIALVLRPTIWAPHEVS